MANRFDTIGCCSQLELSRFVSGFPGSEQARINIRFVRLLTAAPLSSARKSARRAIVLGASFIGLEVAAALRSHDIEVHVVAPESRPLERILGQEMGQFVQSIHEERGVIFHLNETAISIADTQMTLKGGDVLEGDLVVAGIGVRPRIDLAVKAGITVDRGVVVSSVPRNERQGSICCWRYCALARSALWWQRSG